MKREERRIQNIKEPATGEKDFYPADLPNGKVVYASPKNKPVRLYKKIRGRLWHTNFTKDGNEYVDKNLTVKQKTKTRTLEVTDDADISGSLNIDGSYQMDESDIIDSSGYQTGVLKTRQTLLFGRNSSMSATAGTTTNDATTVNGVTNQYGYRMIRDGKVTGVSLQFNCTDASTTAELEAVVQKNGANQSMSIVVNCTSVSDNLGGQSTSNAFTVSAGNTVNVELQLTEADADQVTVDDVAVVVEFES